MEARGIEIKSPDYWFKTVDFVQQNWALIESDCSQGCVVYFIHDGSVIFDSMVFLNEWEANLGLQRNGFRKYRDNKDAQKFIAVLPPPYTKGSAVNGSIYSSGKFRK